MKKNYISEKEFEEFIQKVTSLLKNGDSKDDAIVYLNTSFDA